MIPVVGKSDAAWGEVADSRLAESAGRVKKSLFKTRESSCVCYKVSLFSFKVLNCTLYVLQTN